MQKPARRYWPPGWLYFLTLAIDASLVSCCLSASKRVEVLYLQLGSLAALAVLGVLATGLLLRCLVQKQWPPAGAWLVLVAFNFGSCWAGIVLSLRVIDAPYIPGPPL
jgi:hypothetical protein